MTVGHVCVAVTVTVLVVMVIYGFYQEIMKEDRRGSDVDRDLDEIRQKGLADRKVIADAYIARCEARIEESKK